MNIKYSAEKVIIFCWGSKFHLPGIAGRLGAPNFYLFETWIIRCFTCDLGTHNRNVSVLL